MTPEIRAVADEHALWRRIRPDQVVADPKAPDGRRASTAAFHDSSDRTPMSVVVEPIALDLGARPADAVAKSGPGTALVRVRAGAFRADDQNVFHSPIDSDVPCELAHGSVEGAKPKGARRRWALAAEWVIEPET